MEIPTDDPWLWGFADRRPAVAWSRGGQTMTASKERGWVCRDCGSAVGPGQAFCHHCGGVEADGNQPTRPAARRGVAVHDVRSSFVNTIRRPDD
jgi:hypothetical protein